VSAGFFLAFSAARTRVSSTRSVGDPRANSIAATSTLASIIYPAPPWRNQPRSDR
jgi:hypothetical protein